MRHARVSFISFATLSMLGSLATAGPLNPPPGPITSTYKTLTEVEPRTAISAANTPGDADSLFKITQPGSYYLTGNITGVAGKHGIEIAASGVTLDLNGFSLSGVLNMGAFDGVTTTGSIGSLSSIAVRNGSISNWGDEGIGFGSANARNCAVIDVRVSLNAASGIRTGEGSSITGCSAFNNTGDGIFSGGGTVIGCTSQLNVGNGISALSGTTIVDCTVINNSGTGIQTGFDCTISSCTSYSNNGNGIAAGRGSTVSACSAQLNNLVGISSTAGCTITGCTSDNNLTSGFSADGSTISNCTARQNAEDGIRVGGNCIILANTCSSNGTASAVAGGIHATGSDNRIDGNHCTNADRGILVDAAGNAVVRNTCVSNTIDWIIAANNIYGPVIDRRGVATAFVNGFSAPASTMGSTDPNANFSY